MQLETILFKNIIKKLTNASIINLLRYILRQFPLDITVIGVLDKRAIESSVDYAEQHMQSAVHFRSQYELWRYVFRKRPSQGLIAEFGVYKGNSINTFASMTTSQIFGFDSFEGLQEDWGGMRARKGASIWLEDCLV